MSQALIHSRQLAIGYHRRTIAANINLSITAAQSICLLGSNGAGKSTLFKTLLGLLPPLAGEVYAGSRNINTLSRREFAAVATYVPQAAGNLPDFTVLETVLMACAARLPPFARPGKAERQTAEHSLSQLNIAHMAQRRIGALSGGERQLVWIARALSQNPRLLIMDEPTASLDFANQILVLEHINRLRQQGYAVLFSSHRPEHALYAAQTLWTLHGHTLHSHCPQHFINPDNLARLYGLRSEQIRRYAPNL